jgi:hypothetical protein
VTPRRLEADARERPRRARGAAFTGLALAGALAGVAAACVLEPEVGELLAGACSNTDSDPDTRVSFSRDIRPVLDRNQGGCGCHMPGPGAIGIQLSGLDLGALSSLRAGGFSSAARIVVPADPCGSVLYQKVSDAPPFGSRMPLGGPFLGAADLALLHDWIAEGAADN